MLILRRGTAFTEHDTNLVPYGEIHAIYATGAGTIVFETLFGDELTITVGANSLTSGIAMKRVKAASTASGLIGFTY